MSKSVLLLILSASRFLAPEPPVMVPAPFLFLVHLHGVTFPFLSRQKLSLDSFKCNLKTCVRVCVCVCVRVCVLHEKIGFLTTEKAA